MIPTSTTPPHPWDDMPAAVGLVGGVLLSVPVWAVLVGFVLWVAG